MCLPTVGSFSLLRLRRDTSAQKCCGLVLHRHSRLSCVRNRARLLDFPSWPCHLRPSHVPPQLFRVLLLRRLWLPLPVSSRTCWVAGGRCPRFHLDLPVARHDGRRLEVVADRLPLFNGAQLAIDTTLVSPVRADGLPRRQCAHVDGAALAQARRVKQRTYPALGRARLVVLAAGIGGRWSEEARAFVSQARSPVEHGRHGITVGRPCLHVPVHVHLPCLCWTIGLLWVATENLHPRPLW